MAKQGGIIFTIIGGMLLPLGIVFLLLPKLKLVGGVFILLGLGNLLLGVLISSRGDQK